MKRRTLVMIIVAVALFGLVVAVAGSFLHDGLSSRATPTKFEITVARNARHLAIPSNARLAQNPLLVSSEDLRDARLHFADHCAVCHANDGGGQTMIGSGLYPKPPDLRLRDTQDLTDGELFWIIENGVRFTGMPAFSNSGGHGGMVGSWKLVYFFPPLPPLTSAGPNQIGGHNPQSPDRAGGRQE